MTRPPGPVPRTPPSAAVQYSYEYRMTERDPDREARRDRVLTECGVSIIDDVADISQYSTNVVLS